MSVDSWLNISHKNPDSVLLRVQKKLTNEFTVQQAVGADSVESVVMQRATTTTQPPTLTLDLIAHSQNGVLQLGDWDLADRATAKALKAAWDAQAGTFELEAIRLLGCITASSSGNGPAAMALLHEVFGVVIIGTTVPIGSRDFDPKRYKSTEFLAPFDPQNPERAVEAAEIDSVRTRWFERFDTPSSASTVDLLNDLEHESIDEALIDRRHTRPALRWGVGAVSIADFRHQFADVAPTIRVAEGLLALPEYELLVRVGDSAGDPRYHRATYLLGGAFLRVYPRGYPFGAIVRVHARHDSVLKQIIRDRSELLIAPGAP